MRIKQAHVGVSYFREAFLKKWGLSSYRSEHEPAIFFGIYKNQRNKLLQHSGPAIAVWAGSDASQIKPQFAIHLRKRANIKHIAISSFISHDLDVHQIPHTTLPITPEDFSLFKPTPLGPCIFMYLPKKKLKFYGIDIYNEIRKELPSIKIITADIGEYTRSQLVGIYSKCFMGIRPTPHDGMSNTVIELGMMGRRCVWNGNAPNAIPFTDAKSIIKAIRKEQKRIGETDQALVEKMSSFVDIGDSWLDIDFDPAKTIRRPKVRHKSKSFPKRENRPRVVRIPKRRFVMNHVEKMKQESGTPKVSVIINTYKENPLILRQAVESYLKQKGVSLQLIISSVDGDPSWELAKEYGLDFASIPEPGIYQQLNHAISLVKGDWFAYASGNDIAKPNKLIHEIQCCRDNDKLICYSDFVIVDHNLNPTKKRIYYQYDPEKHLTGNFVNDCAVMHRSILDRFKPFNYLKWGNHAFYDFWLRVYGQIGNVFAYNQSFEWFYRTSPTSSHVVRGRDITKKLANKKLRNELIDYHKRLRRRV